MLPAPLLTNTNIDYTDNGYVGAKIRKKPSRWDKPVEDPIQLSDNNYQDYRSKPIYKDKRDTVKLKKKTSERLGCSYELAINRCSLLRCLQMNKNHIQKL